MRDLHANSLIGIFNSIKMKMLIMQIINTYQQKLCPPE